MNDVSRTASAARRTLLASCVLVLGAACSQPSDATPDLASASVDRAASSAAAVPPKPKPKPRPTTGAEGQFTKFMEDNTAFAAAITEASKGGPDAARKAYDARKDDLKRQYDAIKNLRSDAVSEDTVNAFTENVTGALSDICSPGMGTTAAADQFKQICADYTKLLEVD